MLELVNVLSQITPLREIFQRNGYPQNFIDTCFKLFLSRIHIKKYNKEKIVTVEKNVSAIIPSSLRNYIPAN